MIHEFNDFKIDIERMELWRGCETRTVEPQVFTLLVFLIENRDRVISKDELIDVVWEGRIVSDATLNTRINAARKALDDNGKDQAVIRTLPRRGFRFVAEVDSNDDLQSNQVGKNHRIDQTVRFCSTSHGVQIAYATAGEGSPIVKAGNWLNHLEYDWDSPIWGPLLNALAEKHQMVRYDARGNGLSDWDVEDLSFEAFVRDMETVVDTLALKRTDLLGISQGCAVSIAYAARHPEKVSRLILYGGYACGLENRGNPKEIEQGRALRTIIKTGWGSDNPAFRQIFTTNMIPAGSPQQIEWLNDFQRLTTTAENAARLKKTIDFIDVENLLPEIKAPTLVLHCRDDRVVPFEQGRKLAAMIPNARFIALDGKNHVPLEGDPVYERIIEEIMTFIETPL